MEFTAALFLSASLAFADDPPSVTVRDGAQLRAAVSAAKPGTRILVAPGVYEGGFQFSNLRGSAEHPVLLAAEDSAHPPVLRGGSSGIQLSDPEFVELRDLVFEQGTGNGINIDDGGTLDTPAHDVVLRGLSVRDIGPNGNCDGIKLSGVDLFLIERCTVERWGSFGSAVDMVGCHRGLIERCVFRNPSDLTSPSGVQAKGGSRDITIQRNRFEHAGSRGVNIGGNTGLEYFRPPLEKFTTPRFEAMDIFVQGNTFIGSDAPVAFVGADGAWVRFNTIYLPACWALRVLQENGSPGFDPARGLKFTDNLVVFRKDQWRSGGVNIGIDEKTLRASLRIERNAWTCLDDPQATRRFVSLPVEEIGGVYGLDPMFKDTEHGDLHLFPNSPTAKFGADAFVGN